MSKVAGLQTQSAKAPAGTAPAQLGRRKCACGGSCGLTGLCADCEKKKLLGQPLRVTKRGDEYEEEAHRAAGQVMRMPGSGNGGRGSAAPRIQRRVRAGDGVGIGAAPAIADEVLSSPGQGLDAAARAFFEPRFGYDFSKVRVHAEGEAQQWAQCLDARAFTVGRDIVLGTGQYSAGSAETGEVLAHELAHVVQQQDISANTAGVSASNSLSSSQGAAAPPFIIQRSEVPDAPQGAPDEAPIPITWTISEKDKDDAGKILDPDRGFAPAKNRRPIPPGTIVVPRDYRDVGEHTYILAEWSGGVDWVSESDLLAFDPTYATPRGADAYFQNVKAFPAGSELTDNQKALVERAMKFTDDGSIPTPKDMDEHLELNSELLTRLKAFYRFLVQEHLITDESFGMSGSRKPAKAHELSTKWMLNWKNGFLDSDEKRVELARRLVQIGGVDTATHIVWANDEQVKKLSEALVQIRQEDAELEIARVLIPGGGAGVQEMYDPISGVTTIISAGREAYNRTIDWSDPRIKAITEKYQLSDDFKQSFESEWESAPWMHTELFIRALQSHYSPGQRSLDAVVAEIRDYFSSKEHEPQDDPALEGYDETDPLRYPNIMDVAKSKHLTGDAADIFFPYKLYYYDPIIDAVAKVFGLRRAALAGSHGEFWHYQAFGSPLNGTQLTQKQGTEAGASRP